jgi:outer membrane biosynthesis protein TonB
MASAQALPPRKRRWKEKNENGKRTMETKTKRRVARILLAIALNLAGTSLLARESRKALNSPTPTYPETARQFRLSGIVKVQVVVAPDGQIKGVKVIK